MLKEIKNVLLLIASLLCILGAIAIMVSDVFRVDLSGVLKIAFILSILLGGIPYILNTGISRK